jgi:hypothetical protein
MFVATGGSLSDSTLVQISITGSCAYSFMNILKDFTSNDPPTIVQKSICTAHKYFSNILFGTAVSSASLLALRYSLSSFLNGNTGFSIIPRKSLKDYFKLRQFYRFSFIISLVFSLFIWKMKQKAKNLLWLKQLILSSIHKAFANKAN